MEEEDGDVVAQPGELLPVPGSWLTGGSQTPGGVKDDCLPDSDIWNGNQCKEISRNPNSDH